MNWNKIYKEELFTAKNCYLECGGYCCNNFFGQYYSILDKNNVVLPMSDDEYNEYKKHKVDNLKEKKYQIKIKDKEFIFYLLFCNEKGLCNPHQNRPLICKIYPYIPKVNLEGEVIGFNYASFMDLFYSAKDKHNCPLVFKDEKRIQDEIIKNLPKLDAKMIFIFILLDKVMEKLKSYFPTNIDKLNQTELKKFILKFEMLLLTGKVFKKINIEEIYEDVKNIYGDFL